MYNDPEVSAELHRLAEAEPLAPFDTNAVLTRGRRGRRRRTLLGVSGGVTAVAAIAVAATLIPNISSAKQDPGVAGTENSQFSAVPGVPRGEDGAGEKLDRKEAERRCAIRYGKHKRPLAGQNGFRSARTITYDIRSGETPGSCTIPGGDKPSAALIAAAKADPFPKTTAGQLRNCSVNAWVDMTGWRIMASDRRETLPMRAATVVAVSPSGRTAISCSLPGELGQPLIYFEGYGWGTFAVKLDDPSKDYPTMEWPDGSFGKDMATIVPGGSDCSGYVCKQTMLDGWGRVSAQAVKIVLQVGNGPTQEVQVNDGWFAFDRLDKASRDNRKDSVKIRAYDKDGKLLSKLYPEK